MSRIGKQPISVPAGVTMEQSAGVVRVKGPKGELALAVHPSVILSQQDDRIMVSVTHPGSKQGKALWGLFRALVNNLVIGVTAGFVRILEINGVGYKAALVGQKLVLNLGYSHPIELEISTGLEVKVEKNLITIAGADKQMVGQFAAKVRSLRPPEPYKGKGIKYQDEVIRRKAGKVVKAIGGAK